MSQITVSDDLWRDLVAVAKKRQQKPDMLAARAIQAYLERLADEQLLRRSSQEARKSKLSIAAAELAIKQRRGRNGR